LLKGKCFCVHKKRTDASWRKVADIVRDFEKRSIAFRGIISSVMPEVHAVNHTVIARDLNKAMHTLWS
jgi:hypothetical protein